MTILKDIMTVDEAIAKFVEKFPGTDLTSLELKYDGPFLTYNLKGIQADHLHSYKFNAATGQEMKDKSRPLKARRQEKLQSKLLNTKGLIPLDEITDLALDKVPVDRPYEWELERKKDRTIWEVEMTNELGSDHYEVKIDAQDATILEIEYKV